MAELECVACGRSWAEDETSSTCPACGGILDVLYDHEAIAAAGFGPERLAADPDRSHWRYRDLLPISDRSELPTLAVGGTPVFPLPGLAERLGVAELWIKDDGRSATGSFKDRPSSVAVVRARAEGRDTVACASTGNAASSLAGFAANMGLRAFIFVPAFAPEAKLAQLRVFDATVFVVEGDYDRAYALATEAIEAFGWYSRNAAVNPYLVEGKKTGGLEIAEQMAGRVPDWVSVSVGDGCSIAGVWKGLTEMERHRVIDRLPRMLGTQSTAAAPLEAAWKAGGNSFEPVPAGSVADSINVGNPANGLKALRAVRQSDGSIVAVDDEDITAAEAELASFGVFGEPAGVAGIAGIRRAREDGTIGPDDRVLHVVTGSGLKDVRGAVRAAPREAIPVPPSLGAVREAVERLPA